MMKTGKNKRLLASILVASMLLAMSPFALAEGPEDTTGQGQSQSTEGTDPIEWNVYPYSNDRNGAEYARLDF